MQFEPREIEAVRGLDDQQIIDPLAQHEFLEGVKT
jgi:hypothetical protein